MTQQTTAILHDIKTCIVAMDSSAEVILYGSRTRGDAREDSDWNILILLNRENILFDFEIELMNALYAIEIEKDIVITPLIYSKKDWNEDRAMTPLFENIQKEGILVE